jgi:hypothetical protein
MLLVSLQAIFIALGLPGEGVDVVVWHDLRPDFRLAIVDRPKAIPGQLEARVDAIWQAKLADNPHGLFDGPIHAMLHHTPEEVTCYRTSYRYLVACRRDASLAAALSLTAIGVTGILTCGDGLVLGRRAANMASNRGRWELAPAGALSQNSPRTQLMEELSEELGIVEDRVKSVEAVGITHDPDDRVYDLLLRLHVSLTDAEVRETYLAQGSSEYSELAVVPRDRIVDFVADHRENLVSLVIPALIGVGMLPQQS